MDHSSLKYAQATSHRRCRFKILRIAVLVVLVPVVLIILALGGLTLYLSGSRLTDLVEKEASSYLYADVKTNGVSFTLWSTFPHFRIHVDSLRVVSRTLKNQPDSVRSALPADCDFLLGAKSIDGGINVMGLLAGKVLLGDVGINGLTANIVAYNDTINNFNIFPSSPDSKLHVPYITAKTIRLTDNGPLRFYSAAIQTTGLARLKDSSLIRNAKDKNLYAMSLLGTLDTQVQDLEIFHDFPFSFSGDVKMAFKPLGISLENYHIGLANMESEINMSLDLGVNAKLRRLRYHISSFDLMRLLAYLPGEYLAEIGDIKTNMKVEASVRLTEPYELSSTRLPSFDMTFSVPRSHLSCTMSNGTPLDLNNVGMHATLVFNGRNVDKSYFQLSGLTMSGDGLQLDVEGRVSDLLSYPKVSLNADLDADCSKMMALLPPVKGLKVKGTLAGHTMLGFTVNPQDPLNISDISMEGAYNIRNIGVEDAGIKLSAKDLKINLSSEMDALTRDAFLASTTRGCLNVPAISLKGKDTESSIKGLNLKGRNSADGKSWVVDASIASVLSSLPQGSLIASAVKAKGQISSAANPMNYPFDLATTCGLIVYKDVIDTLKLNKLALDFTSAPEKNKSWAKAKYVEAKDSLTYGAHTPVWLNVKLSEKIRSLLASRGFSMRVKASDGVYSTEDYPAKVRMTGLDLVADEDHVALRDVKIKSQTSDISLKGRVANLRRFLLLGGTNPIDVNCDIRIGNANLNELAHTYEESQSMAITKASGGATSLADARRIVVAKAKEKQPVCESDNTTLLIPRNINASLRFSADSVSYTNLMFTDLRADGKVADGKAAVSDLQVAMSFGRAAMAFGLDTRDPFNYRLNADMNLEKVDLIRFFKKFHSIVVMCPQVLNLTGNVSLGANLNANFFPNMDLEIPSVAANVKFVGSDLSLHQDKFIRRITRMLLIHNSGDIRIPTVTMNASIYDNRVEVKPFDVIFDTYHLNILGMNDFQGDLYYHVGVDHSPLPFKYGINIKGTYSHPKIRLGGSEYKPDEALRLNGLVNNDRVNIVSEAKHFFKMLVRHASASYKATDSK